MAVSPLTPEVAEQLRLPRTEKGLVVTDVDPAGVAASVGIQAGDVIKQANDREVTTVPALAPRSPHTRAGPCWCW